MTDTITLEEYQHLTRRNKFNNRHVDADGYTFDSKAEHRHYLELKLRVSAGAITALRVHPTYTLIEGFRTADGAWVRPTVYEADFSYIENDREIVVDVKGAITQLFALKKKLLLRNYPNIRFVLVQVKS